MAQPQKPNPSKPTPGGEEPVPVTVDDRPAHGAHGFEEYEDLMPPQGKPGPGQGRRPA